MPLKTKQDLCKVKTSAKRMWIRVADPATSKRRLSQASPEFLLFWMEWCVRPRVYFPLAMPRFDFSLEAAADACAHGEHVGMGVGSSFLGSL